MNAPSPQAIRPPVARAALYARLGRSVDTLIEGASSDGGLTLREATLIIFRVIAIKVGALLGPAAAGHHVRRVAGEIDGHGR